MPLQRILRVSKLPTYCLGYHHIFRKNMSLKWIRFRLLAVGCSNRCLLVFYAGKFRKLINDYWFDSSLYCFITDGLSWPQFFS